LLEQCEHIMWILRGAINLVRTGCYALARHAPNQVLYLSLIVGQIVLAGLHVSVLISIAFSAWSPAISCVDFFNTVSSTSDVCWARNGGGCRYSTGVSDSRIGFATIPAVPPPGCGMSMRI